MNELDSAYHASSHKTMGADFDFKKWCNEWLLSSGVNILQPIVKYNKDNTIQSLSIRQFFEQNTEKLNRLRS